MRCLQGLPWLVCAGLFKCHLPWRSSTSFVPGSFSTLLCDAISSWGGVAVSSVFFPRWTVHALGALGTQCPQFAPHAVYLSAW